MYKYTIPNISDGGFKDVLLTLLKPSWIENYYNKHWRLANSSFNKQILMNSALSAVLLQLWLPALLEC